MKIILADKWIKQLCESQGINCARVSRVIIDAQPGLPVFMYITQYGDEGLLELSPPEAVPAKVVEK